MADARQGRLLVVDDEPALMRSLCDTLGDRGFEATGFINGSAALDELRRSEYDILLADLAMPGMDGITLLREALQLDGRLVCVIMTGEGTISTAVEAMRAGAYDYILKPFKMGAILPVLQRGLALRGLRQENARLEQRLREHAAELEAANRELDSFTRSASHDLRSPLSAMLGLVSLMPERFGEQLPHEAKQWLVQIELAGRQVLQLLDDLMRLSRLGRQALDLHPVDIGALAEGVVAELREREPTRQLEIAIAPLPPAHADASLLRQVFVNLVGNAIKFTRGKPAAAIAIGTEAIEGETAYFVRDNGAGFDMAEAGNLFGAFQRLHRQDEFEGSGVGLTIVHRIVARHGGRVWVQAAVNQGACFYFTLKGDTTAAGPAPLPAS